MFSISHMTISANLQSCTMPCLPRSFSVVSSVAIIFYFIFFFLKKNCLCVLGLLAKVYSQQQLKVVARTRFRLLLLLLFLYSKPLFLFETCCKPLHALSFFCFGPFLQNINVRFPTVAKLLTLVIITGVFSPTFLW